MYSGRAPVKPFDPVSRSSAQFKFLPTLPPLLLLARLPSPNIRSFSAESLSQTPPLFSECHSLHRAPLPPASLCHKPTPVSLLESPAQTQPQDPQQVPTAQMPEAVQTVTSAPPGLATAPRVTPELTRSFRTATMTTRPQLQLASFLALSSCLTCRV